MPARITGGGPDRSYGVYLHLAAPEALVLEKESHQETLARHHSTRRLLTRVVAEVVSSGVSRGKHTGSYAVAVRLDGERFGELTAAMSTRYKHLIIAKERNDNCATCEAAITQGERGFQIDLHLPSTN